MVGRTGMEKVTGLFRKCKSLSKLGRPSSYSTLHASKSLREPSADDDSLVQPPAGSVLVFVGSSRRPYVIKTKHLEHPLLIALLESEGDATMVKCEVVLFDHLLWMLENAEIDRDGGEALKELVELYAC